MQPTICAWRSLLRRRSIGAFAGASGVNRLDGGVGNDLLRGLAGDDLLASVSSLSKPGADGNVTASFDNGASITFAGVGPTSSLTDLVDDATAQMQVS